MVVGFQFHKYKGKFIYSRKELKIVYANIFLHCDVQCSSTKVVIYYALKKAFVLQTDPCIKVMVKKMNTFFQKLFMFVATLKPINQCIS